MGTMKGILIALFSVTTLVSAATVDLNQDDVHGILSPSVSERKVNSDPSKAPTICKAPRSEGVLVAHEDCNKFYKCSHGKPVALKCPWNLLYNIKYEFCDWPVNVDCRDRVNPGDDGGHKPEDPDQGNPDCGEVYDDPREAPTICARDDSEGKLIAHENCTQFYECAGGRPVPFKCSSGLFYNPNKKECDWPKNVNCGNRTIPPNNESTECDGNGDSNNNNGTCNCNPSEAPKICARHNSSSILIAHEECNKFYKCLHGHPAAYKCPKKLLYNPYKEFCDWPKNVECGDRIIPEDDGSDERSNESSNSDEDTSSSEENQGNCDPSEAPAICEKKGSDGVLVAHEKCNYFYTCLHGRPFPVPCPHGLHFNPRKGQCDWPKNAHCKGIIIPDDKDPSKAPKICAKKNSEGVLVAHKKCNRFYQCSGGKPVVKKCPTGLFYNSHIKVCDWPLFVNCNDRIIPRHEESEESEEVTKKPIVGHDDPSKAPAICAKEGSDDVLVAHEKCNKFYICSGKVPVALPCPKKLLYNPKKEECDWPEEVECNGRKIPDGSWDCDGEEDNDHDHDGNDDPTKAPKICAKEGTDGVLVAHRYCSKYYICVNHRPLTMRCPKYLFFNPRKNECDWPENVTCGRRITSMKESVPHNANDISHSPPNLFQGHSERPVYDDPSQAHKICARNESEENLIAHEYCNNYYQCVNGVPISMRCPPKLFFDPKRQECDWTENVECGKRTTREESEEDWESGDNSHEHTGNNHDDPSKAPYICSKENSDGVHIAHEYCHKYYVCVNRHPVPILCPEPLLYNPKKEVCDWLWNVECNKRH